jgi:hypothetical protein
LRLSDYQVTRSRLTGIGHHLGPAALLDSNGFIHYLIFRPVNNSVPTAQYPHIRVNFGAIE